jgi:hypothetical protein
MAFTDEQVMLTLAGLTYRGFADPWAVTGHAARVRAAVETGLHDLAPVKDEWDLAWGPATGHAAKELVDSSMLYVVRHRREPARHVVGIRGTNPISLADWTFGDFWVGTTVPWPWAPASAQVAVSASTALGLGVLQSMSARPPGKTAASPSSIISRAVATLPRRGVAVSEDASLATLRDKFRAQATELLTAWEAKASGQRGLAEARPLTESAGGHHPALRRPRPRSAATGSQSDLLTFLRSAAEKSTEPLDVTITGHSKGAALAQAVALWLRETLDVADERWDAGRGARIACYAFAGPTPGNAAFARRFETALGATHHHVRNRNDIVTHAWQADELAEVPTLYGDRTVLFRPIVEAIVAKVTPLDYRQVRPGVREFAGPLQPESRSFPEEFVHQHLDAYLQDLGLDAYGIDALTLFLG